MNRLTASLSERERPRSLRLAAKLERRGIYDLP
jgi:hypothetical protein